MNKLRLIFNQMSSVIIAIVNYPLASEERRNIDKRIDEILWQVEVLRDKGLEEDGSNLDIIEYQLLQIKLLTDK